MADEPLLDLIRSVFTEQGWQIERPDPEATIIKAPVETDAGSHVLWIRTKEDDELVTVFAALDLEVPADRRAEVAELAGRLNQQLAVGSFEVDPDDGAVAFKAGIDVEGDRLSVALLRQLVGHALVAAERAIPLFAAVAEGRFPPRMAAERF